MNFNQWFAQHWAGEDNDPVPSTCDPEAYRFYENARANALAGWNARQAEIDELKEQIQPYLDAEAEAERQRLREEKIEEIVNLCAPSFDARQPRETYPIRHPDVSKLGWWNGASIERQDELSDGSVDVLLRSYVGCGSHETLTLHIPAEWITASDVKTTVQMWCKEETARRAATQALAERKIKEAQLDRLKKELGQ